MKTPSLLFSKPEKKEMNMIALNHTTIFNMLPKYLLLKCIQSTVVFWGLKIWLKISAKNLSFTIGKLVNHMNSEDCHWLTMVDGATRS